MDERKSNYVPKEACTLAVGEVLVESNGDDARSTKFRMVARSGRAIEHPYWGRIVHDLSGMQLERNRVAIDYNHDSKEPIGYANKFNIENGNLEVSGALTPVDDTDAASRVLKQAEAGVPFEASINFGGSGIELENVKEGDSAEVNGYEFSGPGVVVRKWPLRGIAVCLYGADQYTSTTFSDDSGDSLAVTYLEKEGVMPESNEVFAEQEEKIVEMLTEDQPEAEANEAVEAEGDNDTVEAVAEESQELEPVAAVETELSGADFMKAFGRERGAIYFAEGKTFSEAQSDFNLALQSENEELRKKIELMETIEGEADGASFSEPVKQKELYNPMESVNGLIGGRK